MEGGLRRRRGGGDADGGVDDTHLPYVDVRGAPLWRPTRRRTARKHTVAVFQRSTALIPALTLLVSLLGVAVASNVCSRANYSLHTKLNAGGAIKCTVAVTNQVSNADVELRWVDEAGDELPGVTVDAESEVLVETWAGNVLRARGPGSRVLGELVVAPPEPAAANSSSSPAAADAARSADSAAPRPAPGCHLTWTIMPCERRSLDAPFVYELEMPGALSLKIANGQPLGVTSPLGIGEDKVFDVTMDLAAAYGHRNSSLGRTVPVSWTRKVVCPMCGGFGAMPDHLFPCTRCNETGRIAHVHDLTFSDRYHPHRHAHEHDRQQTRHTVCPTCDGYAKVPDPVHVCPVCGGKRTVTTEVKRDLILPRGVYEGFTAVFRGMADEHKFKTTGDVVFKVVLSEDETFELEGTNLHTQLNITLAEAIGGFKRSIIHPSGVEMRVVRFGMTSPGFTIVVKDTGMPRVRPCYHSSEGYNLTSGECWPAAVAAEMEQHGNASRLSFGDMHVHINVGFPTIMSGQTRQRLRDVLNAEGDDDDGEAEGTGGDEEDLEAFDGEEEEGEEGLAEGDIEEVFHARLNPMAGAAGEVGATRPGGSHCHADDCAADSKRSDGVQVPHDDASWCRAPPNAYLALLRQQCATRLSLRMLRVLP
mmetsp:Transcript_11637/g.40755  ORF Transcript_11637/g.40755 Transcript_11637/m.40755 type:complete len:647 (-) Transcript_11637:185-2125(-)